jgi:cyclic-di-AMP phosphodiesterase PgpH
MKADHKDFAATESENTKVIKTKLNKKKYPLILLLLPVLSMLLPILKGIISDASEIAMAKSGIITLILTGAITFYIRSYEDDILKKMHAGALIACGYLGSICLLLFVPNSGMLCFWMLGGLVIAMLIDNRLGLFVNFNMVFILGIMMGIYLESMIQLLILCILLSMLSGAVKEKSTFLYSTIIILSVNIALSCAINDFVVEKIANINYAVSLLSILAVLVVAFTICVIYQKRDNRVDASIDLVSTESIEKIVDSSAQVNTEIGNSKQNAQILGIRTSYEILCDGGNLLLQKLKEFSEELYKHAFQIGDLAGRAANEIGADEFLARAGGLYHEIGKINGKNYIEEGLKLAEDYAFPKELTAILREHNIKYDKPSSPEAAIVMLSDNVVSTIEYIVKTGDQKFTPNKIIENIFQMRLDKGTFDSAGISLMDYKVLKEFYLAEFCTKKEE